MNIKKRYTEIEKGFKEVKIKPALRVNTLKINKNDLFQKLTSNGVKLKKISFLNNGYTYESKFSLGATPEYLQGYYYLQEAAAQIPVEVLNPKENEKILEIGSAPGGKTTQIAQEMKNTGIIVAIENNEKRILSLKNNLERLSVKNVVIRNQDGTKPIKGLFDKILIDAPCSGNYCIEKDFFKKRTLKDFQNRSKIQIKMIENIVPNLKNKGILVYSTCSLEPEENELVINEILEKHKELKLVNTGLKIGDKGITNFENKPLNQRIRLCKRFWPHKTGTQGFFVAKFEKND